MPCDAPKTVVDHQMAMLGTSIFIRFLFSGSQHGCPPACPASAGSCQSLCPILGAHTRFLKNFTEAHEAPLRLYHTPL